MKNKRKFVLVLLLISMILPVFGTAALAEEETNIGAKGQLQEEAGFPLVDEPTSFSIASMQTTYFGPVPELYFTQWYESKQV